MAALPAARSWPSMPLAPASARRCSSSAARKRAFRFYPVGSADRCRHRRHRRPLRRGTVGSHVGRVPRTGNVAVGRGPLDPARPDADLQSHRHRRRDAEAPEVRRCQAAARAAADARRSAARDGAARRRLRRRRRPREGAGGDRGSCRRARRSARKAAPVDAAVIGISRFDGRPRMTEDSCGRSCVRKWRSTSPPSGARRHQRRAVRADPSHARFNLPSRRGQRLSHRAGGLCTHCGYCKSYGH